MKKGQMELFEATSDRPHVAMAIADTDQSPRSLDLLVQLIDEPQKFRELRQAFRDFAGRGRFVIQHESDGTGAELLRSLQQDVELAGGQWQQPDAIRIASDLGYPIPSSWTCVRLENLLTFGPRNGYSPKSVNYPTGTKTLTLTATTSGRFNGEHCKYVDEVIPPDSFLWLEDGDLLIQRANTIDYVGSSAVFRGQRGSFIYPDLMMKVRLSKRVCVDFIHLMLLTSPARAFLRARASGTAGSMPKINQTDVRSIPIPLPPLAEQKRIVAKVDHLMALCDELEARQTRKRDTGDRLTKAALGALTSAEGPEELQVAWKRVPGSFREMIDRAEKAQALRASIIELGMRGRLTSSSDEDEPVEQLLERIRADLKAAGADRAGASVGPDAIPFAIPATWRWLRWGDLTTATGSGWSPQCETRPRENDEWGVLKVSAVSWFRFKPEENKALPAGVSPRPEFAVRSGDFLMSRANTAELVGRSVVVGEAPENLILSDKIIRCTFSRWVEKKFVNLYNRTGTARAHYVAHASGTSDSMKNISRDVILSMPVPVPPLAEQRRIVARIEQLFALCDDLEAKLRARDEKSARLAAALVAEAIA